MGDGTSSYIECLSYSTISTYRKLLHLTNVLQVPKIWKNLFSVSQFVQDNNVFFEFLSFHYLVKDIKTQEILLRDRTHEGLYQFSPVLSSVSMGSVRGAELSLHNTELGTKYNLFELWHRLLGHPSSNVVSSVLKTCNVVVNTNKLQHVSSACQQGKSHKLPFVASTTMYSHPFDLVVFDLLGPVSINCRISWYYVSFVNVCSRFT